MIAVCGDEETIAAMLVVAGKFLVRFFLFFFTINFKNKNFLYFFELFFG